MKKCLLLVALSMIAQALVANVIEIENRSQVTITGWIQLLGRSCPARSLKKVPLEIAARSTQKVPSKDCCAYAMELYPNKTTYAKWGGGEQAIIPAIMTAGLAAMRFCGKSEKFEFTLDADHKPIIKNVTGK